MKTSLISTKLASLFTTLTACATLALGSTGCLVSGSIGAPDYTDPDTVVIETPADPAIDSPPAAIAEVFVDAGATMSANMGEGVGVFVQYDEGGFWTLYTTCDTAISGAPCDFDILAYTLDPEGRIANAEGFDLEVDDTFVENADGSLNLRTATSYGMNGFTFDTEPGAVIELDVTLDGVAQPQFIYLVSDGLLLQGVPTNPIDISPSTP